MGSGNGNEHREDVGAVVRWCRQRARREVGRARQLQKHKLAGKTLRQSCIELGLTRDQFRDARRWLNRALSISLDDQAHLTVDDAIVVYAEQYVELVLRVGLMRRAGRSAQEIRKHLGLSEDEFLIVDGWWRDGMTATMEE